MTTPSTNDSDYLEQATRISFMGGLNRQVVDAKWAGFRRAFHDFDIGRVAAMSPEDIERLTQDDSVIRYEAKLRAVVTNAQTMADIADEHGSFHGWVAALVAARRAEGAAKELAKHFSYISQEGARHWLYATGYDIGEVSEKVRRKYGPAMDDGR